MVSIRIINNADRLVPFYDMRLVEGGLLNEADVANAVLLNEAAVKALGMTNPVGKWIGGLMGLETVTIKGVLKDAYINPPTMPAIAMAFTGVKERYSPQNLIKFQEGRWKELEQQVSRLVEEEYPNVRYELINTEEYYDNYLEAEHLLVKLLGAVSLVCILISAFGIFSLVTLSCEQRRKEIAIRKVNGARIGDILRMFAREYLCLLAVASLLAFPIGYSLMKQWLQNYVKQTSISLWIYVAILAGVAVVIALCIGWRVWQAARQNPAEVVKSE